MIYVTNRYPMNLSFVLECLEIIVSMMHLSLHLLCLQQIILIYALSHSRQTQVFDLIHLDQGLPICLSLQRK